MELFGKLAGSVSLTEALLEDRFSGVEYATKPGFVFDIFALLAYFQAEEGFTESQSILQEARNRRGAGLSQYHRPGRSHLDGGTRTGPSHLARDAARHADLPVQIAETTGDRVISAAQIIAVLRRVLHIGIASISIGELLSGFRAGKREKESRQELGKFLDSPRVTHSHGG